MKAIITTLMMLILSTWAPYSVAQIIDVTPEALETDVHLNSQKTVYANVENRGSETLNFTFNRTSNTPDWATFNTSEQSVPPGQNRDVGITIVSDDDYHNLSTYYFNIHITHNAPSQYPIDYNCYITVIHPVEFTIGQSEFEMERDDEPVSTLLTYYNRSTEPIDYSLYVYDADWITLDSYGGHLEVGGSDDIIVTIDPEGVPTGTNYGSILLASTEGGLWTDITLNISGPLHEISPTSFNITTYHRSDPVEKTLTITNYGSSSLSFDFASYSVNWLNIEPDNGFVNPQSQVPITFTFDPIDYGDEGDEVFETDVELTTSDPINPIDIIPVTFTILAEYPIIDFSTSPIVLKKYSNDPEMTYVYRTILNEGFGRARLHYEFSDDRSWITAENHGTLRPRQSRIISMGFSSAGLGWGTYTGHIFVDHDDLTRENPLVVDVTMRVYDPIHPKQPVEGIPDKIYLSPNYPNPANPSTVIQFGLPSRSDIRLEIFDIMGRRIAVLADGPIDAGYHEIIWDGKNSTGGEVASGIYFYRLETDDYSSAKKMLMLK